MSSLSQKLAMFQSEIKKENDQEARQEIDRIPMARLKDVTIAFGKAKLGLKFSEAFQDQSWTKMVRGHVREQSKDRASALPPLCEPASGGRGLEPRPSQLLRDQGANLLAPFCTRQGSSDGGTTAVRSMGRRGTPTRRDLELGTSGAIRFAHDSNRIRAVPDHPAPRAEIRDQAGTSGSMDDDQGGTKLSRGEIEQVCNLSQLMTFLGKQRMNMTLQRPINKPMIRYAHSIFVPSKKSFNKFPKSSNHQHEDSSCLK